LKVRTGILAKHNEQLELYRVKDISVQEPLLLRLFSLGSVVLETSDKSTPIMVIEAIPNAKFLGDQIRKNVEQLRDSKRVREVDFQ
jgi:uncharacterized membrane protein YdbT with pleckstrin-like domain